METLLQSTGHRADGRTRSGRPGRGRQQDDTDAKTDLSKAVDVLEKVYGRFEQGELAHCFQQEDDITVTVTASARSTPRRFRATRR